MSASSSHRADPEYLDCFYSGLSSGGTEDYLRAEPTGTYLLRDSKSVPSACVVAWKSSEKIEQVLLIPLSSGGYRIDGTDFVFDGIGEFLHANKKALRNPLNKSNYNHGAISQTEAIRRLSPHDVGTFFLRASSSLKGVIVVSLRTARGVEEFRAHVQPDGSYMIEGDTLSFRTCRDLMHVRPDVFLRPLSCFAFMYHSIDYDDAVRLLRD